MIGHPRRTNAVDEFMDKERQEGMDVWIDGWTDGRKNGTTGREKKKVKAFLVADTQLYKRLCPSVGPLRLSRLLWKCAFRWLSI